MCKLARHEPWFAQMGSRLIIFLWLWPATMWLYRQMSGLTILGVEMQAVEVWAQKRQRLSSIEPKLMCRGCLHWHPMKYQRVSRSGCSCSLASLCYMTGVPCMRVRSKVTPTYTGYGSCFRHWPFMWTFSSQRDLLSCRWKTLVTVLDVLDFRRHSWQYLARWARSAVCMCISEKVSA